MPTAKNAPVLIIPVEIQAREMFSRILLTVFAVQMGFRVILGQDQIIRRLAPFLPKGVVFDKGLGLARHGKPKRLTKLGHVVTALDEEGTGFFGSPEQFLSVRLSDETLHHCTRWFCINEEMREAAMKKYPAHSEKFVTSGLLRTDLWRKELRPIYSQNVAQIKNEYGPFILFCSNFSRIIHGRGSDFVERQIEGQATAYADVVDKSKKIQQQGQSNLNGFLEVLPKLTQWFPDMKVVIRPHPAESTQFWREQFAGNNRVEVISRGNATDWILASQALIHHGCTTGIEAEILGQSHVMFAPFPDDHHDTELMKAFAPIVKNEKDLKQFFEQVIHQGHRHLLPINEKQQFFANLDGTMATEIVARELSYLSIPGEPLGRSFPMLEYLPRMLVAKYKPRSKTAKAYSAQKWKPISTDYFEQVLMQISECLGVEEIYRVSQPVNSLFEISSAG